MHINRLISLAVILILILTSTTSALNDTTEPSQPQSPSSHPISYVMQNNTPPFTPSNPIPAHNTTNISIVPLLEWDGGDPDQNDTVTYSVYLGTISPPPFRTTIGPYPANHTHLTYQVGPLIRNRTYYWTIIAQDNASNTTGGPIWQFTTTNTTGDNPPLPPQITGPTTGGVGIDYTFSLYDIDPDGDDIFFKINWGDGNISEWLGPYTSNRQIYINNTWNQTGTFNITAIARDSELHQSNASPPHQIIIQRHIEYENYKPGHIYLRFLSFNESYIFIPFLEYLELSILLTSRALELKATPVTPYVDKVIFEAHNQFSNISIQVEDDNKTDGFDAQLKNTTTSIYVLTLYAYNENDLLLDKNSYRMLLLSIGQGGGSNATPQRIIRKIFT